ncbi:MAG: DUF2254 domain-containing protein [Verrucomicrobiae bacterium]|nr:DUF2254 domain-containing protein [Verrucomicrobiae bacterium]
MMSLLVVAWVALAWVGDEYLPENWPVEISRETLMNLFGILASTMLTVATFSVSAISSAYASVANSASPRATRIVMADGSVRSMLGAFLATFIYAVVSITALSAVSFGKAGRFLLFVAFCVLVGWVLVSFLRWVDRVTRLGRLGDTVERVMELSRRTFSSPKIIGGNGGVETREPAPSARREVKATECGYLMYLDMDVLQKLAETIEGKLWLAVRPGSLITPGRTIARIDSVKEWPEDGDDIVRSAMTLGDERSAETDPRFCLILLAEIADRALSPAINDPGTAIAVLRSQIELFDLWVKTRSEIASSMDGEKDGEEFPNILVPEIEAEELVSDAFTPIARDGAGSVEVGVRLQKALVAIRCLGNEELAKSASEFSALAIELAEQALISERHREAVRLAGSQSC